MPEEVQAPEEEPKPKKKREKPKDERLVCDDSACACKGKGRMTKANPDWHGGNYYLRCDKGNNCRKVVKREWDNSPGPVLGG